MNPTFNPTAKTLTFGSLTTLDLTKIALITNVTSNKVIYQFQKTGYGGTASGNVLSLQYDTSTMASSDNIRVDYTNSDSQGRMKVAQSFLDATTDNIEQRPMTDFIIGNTVTGSGQDFLPVTDISNWSSFSVQTVGTFNATLQVRYSNDATNWFNYAFEDPATGIKNTNGQIQFNRVVGSNVISRYLWISCSAYTSGTITGNVRFSSNPWVSTGSMANQAGTWNTSVNGAWTATTTSVTTTSTTILAANTNRKALIIPNTSSSATLYVNLTNTAATVNDIPISPNNYLKIDRYAPTAAVNAIASAGTITINAQQGS